MLIMGWRPQQLDFGVFVSSLYSDDFVAHRCPLVAACDTAHA